MYPAVSLLEQSFALTGGGYPGDMSAQRAVAVRTRYCGRPGRRAIVVSHLASRSHGAGWTLRDLVLSERTASPEVSGGDSLAGMSAQPVHEHDPDDPVEILHVLPDRFREQFLAEYAAAAEAARQVEGYRALHDLLRRWRLTAAAYSEPGFEARLGGVREAVRTGSLEGSVPVEEIVPDWPARLNRR